MSNIDISQIVRDINQEYFESSDLIGRSDYVQFIEFVGTPVEDVITYRGDFIWDSENSPYMETSEEFEKFLLQEITAILTAERDMIKFLKARVANK